MGLAGRTSHPGEVSMASPSQLVDHLPLLIMPRAGRGAVATSGGRSLIFASPKSPFTDRTKESRQLTAAIASQRSALALAALPQRQLRNLAVFHGYGGIGKTELSTHAELWLSGRLPEDDPWGPAPAGAFAIARIDLHVGNGAFDVVSALVEIRTALGRTHKRWSAFDLAFAAYWSVTHPSLPLPPTRSKDSQFASTLGEFMQDLAGDLGALNTATGIGSRVVRVAAREFRRRRSKAKAHETDERFDELLEACLEQPSTSQPEYELAAELATLITSEIVAMPAESRPLLVVFVDTFERLLVDPRRAGERLLNHLVVALPFALFVVTGRDLLNWNDPNRVNLHRAGPAIWPQLVMTDGRAERQHQLANLSPADAGEMLRRCRDGEQLPITDEVLAELVTQSGGWPLYLDVALERARIAKLNDVPAMTVEDVKGSFHTMVLRLSEDLPHEERLALRAACMVPYFDIAMVAAAAQVSAGAVERLTRRSLVAPNPSAAFPFRVHDEIRPVVRDAGADGEGGWSHLDWQAAAERAMASVKDAHDAASVAHDSVRTLDAAALALHLVAGTGCAADWLPDALSRAPSVVGLVNRMPMTATSDAARIYLDYLLARAGQPDPESGRQALLRIAAGDSPIANTARRAYAYRLRSVCRWDEAIEQFDILIGLEKPQLHLYQRAVTLADSRRFAESLQCLPMLVQERTLRLRGLVGLSHGIFDIWSAAMQPFVAGLREAGRQREYLEFLTEYLMRSVWIDCGLEAAAQQALADCTASAHGAGQRSALCALALLRAGQQEAVEELVAKIHALDTLFGVDISPRVAEPLALDAFVRSDVAAAERVRDYIARRSGPRGRTWIPTEILLDAIGRPASDNPIPTRWLEPSYVVHDRWLTLAESIRTRSASSHRRAASNGSEHPQL